MSRAKDLLTTFENQEDLDFSLTINHIENVIDELDQVIDDHTPGEDVKEVHDYLVQAKNSLVPGLKYLYLAPKGQ